MPRGYELLLILLVLILLFGAKRLPDTARALGSSLKIFKKSVRDEGNEQSKPQAAAQGEITSSSDVVEPTRVDEPHRTER